MGDKQPNIYIIAGEASGDLHGSNLVKALKTKVPNGNFRFWGGDLMQHELGAPVKHIKELAFMGFVEVLANLRTILGNISFCKKDIENFQTDILILIDYPGFNLRIAEWAKSKGIKVIYYVSPQIWAWKQSRVHKIKKCVDLMLCILPFEQDFYKKFDYHAEYVGHPLLDAVENFRRENQTDFRAKHQLDDKPILAILAGSRKQEISKKLPIMLNAAKAFPNYQVVIAGAPSMNPEFYKQFHTDEHTVVFNETYPLLDNASLAIVTSGTATLETALFKVPEVVCYVGNPLSYLLAKKLIKVKFISLVNLILDREVVRELIQHECTSENIVSELKKLEVGAENRAKLITEYEHLTTLLGKGGASEKAANEIVKLI